LPVYHLGIRRAKRPEITGMGIVTESGYLSAEPGRGFVSSWLLTTDHKRIGVLYLFSILSFFLVGVVFGLLMRLELISTGPTIMEARTYNAFFRYSPV
jgi:cytochrome c oxidase subunit 1